MTGESPPATRSLPQRWLRSLAAGLILAAAALVAAPLAEVPIRLALYGKQGEITATTLFAGVWLTGWPLWWVLVARHDNANWLRGGVTGVLVACLSYPTVLFLAEFLQVDWQSRSAATAIPERLEHVLALAGLGFLTTGFVATAILGLVGMATGAAQTRLDRQELGTTSRLRGMLDIGFRALASCAVAIVILLMAAFIALTLLPMRPLAKPDTVPRAATHEDALSAFALARQQEAGLRLHPRCGSILLTHGEKVARAVVFFHGLTNCPAQADELAPLLFALGYNVLVPRLPGHGEADALTLALADVNAEDFIDTARRSMALAQGLGDDVTIVGLSAGSTVAAHQAQQDGAVDKAMLVAPFLAPEIVPRWAAQAATNLLLLTPNMMVWWDPETPYSLPDMDYAYPRFATHALGEIMRLGRIVSAEASAGAPAAQQIDFLLNEADLAVNNGIAVQLATAWHQHGGSVTVRILPQSDGLPHDLIDPRQPNAAVDVVYPILVEMISSTPPGHQGENAD